MKKKKTHTNAHTHNIQSVQAIQYRYSIFCIYY